MGKVSEFMHFIPIGNAVGIGIKGLFEVLGDEAFILIQDFSDPTESDPLGIRFADPVDFPVGKVVAIA